MNFFGLTHRGAVREQNQDSYEVRDLADGGVIAVVCDGMGGARAGHVASHLAVETFMDALQQNELPMDEKIRWHMEEAAQEANQVVYHRSAQDEECSGMGTTLVTALARSNGVYILNEGDSRCYHIGESANCITRDHSLVEALVERGELTKEQARCHPHKNLITRALGTEPNLRADFYQHSLLPSESLLLCSDGLSNVVTEEEMMGCILSETNNEARCHAMLNLALERGAPDNVTVILVTNE